MKKHTIFDALAVHSTPLLIDTLALIPLVGVNGDRMHTGVRDVDERTKVGERRRG